MTQPQLDFVIGTSVQVSSTDKKIQYSTVLLGADRGNTIITRLPSAKLLGLEQAIYDDLFFSGKVFIFRMILNGVVHAFKTATIASYHKPSRLLITEHPAEVQTRELRKEKRYPCTLPIKFNDPSIEGLIANISTGGCQIVLSKTTAPENIEALQNITEEISLDITYPNNDNISTQQAEIKSIKNSAKQCILGIAFSGNMTAAEQYINSLQLEEIGDTFEID
jgi:hypothetical protein